MKEKEKKKRKSSSLGGFGRSRARQDQIDRGCPPRSCGWFSVVVGNLRQGSVNNIR